MLLTVMIVLYGLCFLLCGAGPTMMALIIVTIVSAARLLLPEQQPARWARRRAVFDGVDKFRD